MASRSEAYARLTDLSALDQGGKWFWNFLKHELTPYPGRLWVVGRVTIAATIIMLLIMTFKLPSGFLGAIFAFFVSRENPTASFTSGFRSILAFGAATVYALITLSMLTADPMTHYLWVAFSLFISFYLIHIFTDYGTAAAFGFMIAGAIPLWDQHNVNVNDRVENTLWVTFVVIVGIVVSVAVEYVFRRVHPITDLTEGIEERLQIVENVLRSVADNQPLDKKTEDRLALYSSVGTSRLRRLIVRSTYSLHFKSQMNAAIALLGRLIDICASFKRAIDERARSEKGSVELIDETERERCRQLADEIAELVRDLLRREVSRPVKLPGFGQPSKLPFLPAMENTVTLIPKTFSGSESMNVSVVAPFDEVGPSRLFLADSFSNPDHLKFAIRGTLAAMACYTVYHAIDWTGLSTSLPTCFITALSTIGSSRQKQFLRLAGVIVGGIIIGMGAQVFILPFLNSIAGFTPLFFIVTAIAAWIATASARLSYLGVQLALAFFLINLQEFTIQTSLAIARDRVFGVLLGLLAMWLIFDRLWVRNALDEMQAAFARNLELCAQIAEQLLVEDQAKAILRLRILRDQINAGFEAVRAQSDGVLFEFGPDRERKMQIREDIRRWQPTVRTLLLLRMTMAQYRTQMPIKDVPPTITAARKALEQDIACETRNLANVVSGKPPGPAVDLHQSGARFVEETRRYYESHGGLTPVAFDVIDLTESFVSTLEPLSQDIRATFAGRSMRAESKSAGALPNSPALGTTD
jgi:multidrug resistance protein MdtO